MPRTSSDKHPQEGPFQSHPFGGACRPGDTWAGAESRPGDLSAYTYAMRSVADDLRDELQDELLRLPFEERIALILQLGERGVEMFCQANGLDRETAIRELQRQRQAGRT